MFSNKLKYTINIVFCLIIVFSAVFAGAPTVDWPTGENTTNKVQKVTGNVWATVRVIVQILAVAAVVFAGLRYMFTSADGRADIKKDMLYLVIGAVLVFGATTVINFVVDATNEIIGK